MVMAGILAHEREGQSLEHVVPTLRRRPMPRRMGARPLMAHAEVDGRLASEDAQRVTQFMGHDFQKPSACFRLEVTFFL